jgi:hypothetical protein
MAIETVRRCDMPNCPRKGDQVKTYEIAYPDGRLEVDLCKQHADPLIKLRSAVPVKLVPPRPTARRRARSTTPVDPSEMPKNL